MTYCAVIAAVSLLGGYIPLASRINHRSMQFYLSFSAGAMLGAAFFHMLPESAELAGRQFGLWAACGVIGLYIIERFISPHSHDANGYPHHDHADTHHADHEPTHDEKRSAAPHIAGWSAVAGLSIHTFLGGVALGSAVLGSAAAPGVGLAVFLATVFHKPADAFTISTLLIKGGTTRRRALLVQAFFACLIPLGVIFFYLGKSLLATPLESVFTGSVIAFSAGTFLCIALSDLLPEVQFHSHDRVGLFLAVVGGAAMMYGTSLFEP
ncbi:ZIP family metal transporter [uncultured Thiodictyon sp.]|uniref:ZIP family metal transporter n=1 Tax=uncultured Thiodictyon sp. TaxID=1846217 RepID=UPI0025DF2B52|nr:ZIP family metal transporter [uncultured Thiodictyon sp.]